ncbi:MAG TPA: prepilin-type N-terminal cleavage/methylation domain-containing protein [Solirubrobacteraceae bacterium]|nr:prepilin-type N-terminal cleavage/methylation domain-containing protein [Solirubrobacteraceae bacterium]
MTRPNLRLSDQSGFSLVELLVATLILLIGVAGTIAMLDGANARTIDNRAREAGTGLAREVVERTRSLPYTAITPNGLAARLQAMGGMNDSDIAQPGWQVNRRGTVFTIAISSCSADDPKDGVGTHDAASWCSGGGAPTSPPDRNPDDYKRVTVDVTWDQRDARGAAHEQTLINSPGNAAGPSITALTLNGQPDTIVCPNSACVSSLTFSLTTSATPSTVPWSIDGADQGTASGGGTAWQFSWDLANVTDGAYLIGVRAYDAQGRSGATRTKTVTLNRFDPLKPRGFAAGRNGSIVDAEWIANAERDIVGYRLFRSVDGGDYTQVTSGTCSSGASALTTKTACYDPAPPAGTVVYAVRALDRRADGSLREGPSSDPITVTATNPAPQPLTTLTRSPGVGATTAVTLEWTVPGGSPAPAFYRIYRDGVLYTNRYDRTGTGTDTSWTDPRPDGESHTYWVTAVSANLAESTAKAAQ